MKRYIVRKYVMANSLAEALKNEKKVVAEDGWIDEKQPEPEQKMDAIGFDTSPSRYYYSPHLKRKKKK
jgi:hypothetical protein